MISHMLRYLHANQSYGTFKANDDEGHPSMNDGME